MDCTQKSILRKKFEHADQPVAIFGNGVSAKGVVHLLQKIGIDYIIYDQDPKKGNLFDPNRRHSLVVCSPSFLSHHPWVRVARDQGLECISELDLASIYIDCPIIGITGTNGKTTITTFLAEFFKFLGYRACDAGNIGTPLTKIAVQEKTADIIFCEVSSFQSEQSQIIHFDHVIWTNFAPNHLNVHADLQEYFQAKFHLFSLMNSVGFCGESVARYAKQFGYELPVKIVHMDLSGAPKNYPKTFSIYPQRENWELIKAFCELYPVKYADLLAFASKFCCPKYRLEDLGMVLENHYWNDAKSTNFASLESALRNFTERVIWIGGGRSKGENLREIIPLLKPHVELALLIGETGKILQPLLANEEIDAIYVKDIENALIYIKNACIREKTIVFSPAFSSFDQFENYIARGKHFEECIFSLKKRLIK